MIYIVMVWVLILLIDLIRAFYWQKQVKKQAIRMDYMHAEMLESAEKVRIAFKNAQATIVEMQSLKRWTGETINQLQQHGEKLDELLAQVQAVDREPIDLDEMMRGIEREMKIEREIKARNDWPV